MIEHVLQGGVSGIFLLGSSGEGPLLSADVCMTTVEQTVRHVDSRVPVLVGIIETATGRVIETGKAYTSIGVDAIVTMAPFYYGYQPEHILHHFLSIAEQVPLPQIAYNNSPRVGHTLTPQLIEQLLAEKAIEGIKDSDGAMTAFQAFVELKRSYPTFQVAQGAEHIAAMSVVRGADGLVLGLANVAPRLCVDLYEAAKAGDLAKAWELQRQLSALWQLHLQGNSPLAAMKQAAALLNLCEPHICQPLHPPTAEQTTAIRDILANLHVLER
jgi:4-hydroxy-tetrahydrodipicolinate synthase